MLFSFLPEHLHDCLHYSFQRLIHRHCERLLRPGRLQGGELGLQQTGRHVMPPPRRHPASDQGLTAGQINELYPALPLTEHLPVSLPQGGTRQHPPSALRHRADHLIPQPPQPRSPVFIRQGLARRHLRHCRRRMPFIGILKSSPPARCHLPSHRRFSAAADPHQD